MIEQTKKCKKCEETKAINKFYWSRGKSGNIKDKIYHSKICKKCQHKRARNSPNRQKTTNEYRKRYCRDPKNKGKIILRRFIKSDMKKGWHCNLDIEFVESLLDMGCKYCGEQSRIKLTLDRIDNGNGHIKNNVVCSCIRCNFIRRDMPYVAFECLAPHIKKIKELGLFGDWGGCSNSSYSE